MKAYTYKCSMYSDWYVIRAGAGREQTVLEICQKYIQTDGEDVFLPMKNIIFKRGQNFLYTRFPLFTGYLFYATEDPERLSFNLRVVKGTEILTTGNIYTPIYKTEEEMLMKLGGPKHIVDPSKGFKIGKHVIVQEGPLKGLEGIILKVDRHKRKALIEVNLCGAIVQTFVSLDLATKEQNPEGYEKLSLERPDVIRELEEQAQIMV